jgi:hypothetical protein
VAKSNGKPKRSANENLSQLDIAAHLLKYLMSAKHGILKVTNVTDIGDSEDRGNLFTEVTVSIAFPNPQTPNTGVRFIAKDGCRDFFASWPVQREFLLWLGTQFSERLPHDQASAKYKKKFLSLTTGRPPDLPPKFYLTHENEVLGAQLREAKAFLITQEIHRHRPRSKNKLVQEFANFAKDRDFKWARLVESGRLDLDAIAKDDLRGTAHYILSRRYNVSIEAVRTRLLRNG